MARALSCRSLAHLPDFLGRVGVLILPASLCLPFRTPLAKCPLLGPSGPFPETPPHVLLGRLLGVLVRNQHTQSRVALLADFEEVSNLCRQFAYILSHYCSSLPRFTTRLGGSGSVSPNSLMDDVYIGDPFPGVCWEYDPFLKEPFRILGVDYGRFLPFATWNFCILQRLPPAPRRACWTP